MVVGTILLTKGNVYVDANGNLPKRPSFDKALLGSLLQSNSVSEEGYMLLPDSLKKLCYVGKEYNMPVTIKELDKADLLIVSRSVDTVSGKVFRFDNFKCILKDRKVELWIRN